MSNLIQTAVKEVLRKEVLEMCYQAGTTGCSIDVLAAAFAHSGEYGREELERQVNYLEGKGLVDVQKAENKVLDISRQVVRLTAEGTDYLEGNAGQFAGIGV